MWLLVIAFFGFIVPNGLFVYWLVNEYSGWRAVLHDKLAMSFIIDCLIVLVILSVYFARHPLGKVKWQWFTILSLLGGMGFSLPLYYWLNTRQLKGGVTT